MDFEDIRDWIWDNLAYLILWVPTGLIVLFIAVCMLRAK